MSAAKASRRMLLSIAAKIGVGASLPPLTRGVARAQIATPVATPVEHAVRPSVVLVITDDMRDTDWQALPQTSALFAERGVRFPNFFLTTPTCGPSRASILTGLYAHEHGIFLGDDKDREGGVTAASMFDESGLPKRTIARTLQDAGYHTALFGKYLNGYNDDDPVPIGWDEWAATSTTRYLDFKLNEDGKPVSYKDGEYQTDVLADMAVATIETTPADQPLFLYFSPRAPHAPTDPAPRHLHEFTDAKLEANPAIDEEDISDKPAFLRKSRVGDPVDEQETEVRRLQSLLSVDEAIIRIVAALEETGRLANTYLFVLSDNGFAMGHHRWRAKGLPYDTITRVTMMAMGPALPGGTSDSRIVANIDLAPTIAELASVTLEDPSGHSLLADGQRAGVLLENENGDQKPAYRALRSVDWLYVEWDTSERELYFYPDDPYELENLLADWEGHTPGAAAIQVGDVLHARLEEMKRCQGHDCFVVEAAPLDV
ncbi:MAG: sulfatase [Thermomicrobiales bacterium]